MADHYIDCDLSQARRVAEELEHGFAWVEMAKQPRFQGVAPTASNGDWIFRNLDGAKDVFRCPYAPNDRLRWREPWAFIDWWGRRGVQLKRDAGPSPALGAGVWQPAATMPDAAIRLEITVGTSRPVERDGVWYWEVRA